MRNQSFKTNGKELNFWSTTERFESQNTKKINEYVSNFLKFLEGYTNLKDGTTKMDIVEISEKDAAMENWGLITIGLKYVHKWIASERYGLTIAHEIAHYWFGNMVTCKDWSE